MDNLKKRNNNLYEKAHIQKKIIKSKVKKCTSVHVNSASFSFDRGRENFRGSDIGR